MKRSQIIPIAISSLLALASTASLETQAQEKSSDVAEQVHDAGDAAGDAAEAIGETMDDVAEHVGEVSEEFSKQLGKWMDEHGENLNGWTNEHGKDWQTWANSVQGRAEKWAEAQNKQWGSWSQLYETEMKSLTAKLDQEDLSAEEVGKLIDKNLDMLSKMPIGQMIENGIKEAADGLKTAPLKSLDGLKDIAGEAFQDSVKAAGEVASTGAAEAMMSRDKVNELMDKLQKEYNQKSSELNEAYQQQMKQLHNLAEEVEKEIQDDDSSQDDPAKGGGDGDK